MKPSPLRTLTGVHPLSQSRGPHRFQIKHSISCPLLFLLSAAIGLAQQTVYTAPFGPGGTWNIYQLIENPRTWNQAKTMAEALPAPAGDPEIKGHLVTTSSRAENDFVLRYSGKQNIWCGLTDNERFGGKESYNHPLSGWKWITAEPFTYSNWKPTEPDDWPDAGGEDAVLIDRHGRWTDAPTGTSGQSPALFPYVVEWETRSKGPVPGAVSIAPVWPVGYKFPPTTPGKWSLFRISGAVPQGKGQWFPDNLPLVLPILRKDEGVNIIAEEAVTGNLPDLWVHDGNTTRQNWVPGRVREVTNFPAFSRNYVATISGSIHVEKSGTYTFLISAGEGFALRIGNRKWKSVTGDGYIDPLDPLTVTQAYGSNENRTLAVMDLKAGDHRVEAIWMCSNGRSGFQVLSASGTHLSEGATTAWHTLGAPPSEKKIPVLGITEDGWTIDYSTGNDLPAGSTELKLQDGLALLEIESSRVSVKGVEAVNFADAPATNPTRYPKPSLFPDDRPDTRHDEWPLRATAKLVVPEDGLYQIGMMANGYGAMRIEGAKIENICQAPQGIGGLNINGDTFDFDGRQSSDAEPKISLWWDLKKGEHDIQVLYVKRGGPAYLSVFSSPYSPFPPSLLKKGGAGMVPGTTGLPHAKR